MDASLFPAFLTLGLLWLVAAITPGPNFFVVMSVAAGRGRRAALACVLGTVVGTAIWAGAGFFGLKALFAAFPAAAAALKILGAAYLIWVGVGLWRGAAQPLEPGEAPLGRAFMTGLLTNLANPKTAAFAASLFAVALPAGVSTGASLAAIGLVCAISAGWYVTLALLASTERLMRAYAKARAAVMRATGILFAGFGVKLMAEA